MTQRTKSMFMLVVLLFSIMSGGYHSTALAAAQEATLKVIGSNDANLYEAPVTYGENATALDVLVSVVGVENVEIQEYEGLGKLVTAIDGLENNTTDNTYWMLYINGIGYQSAADKYLVHPNDVITFKYEGWNQNSASIEVINNNETQGPGYPISFIGEPTAFDLLQVYFGHDNIGYSVHETYGKMLESINGLSAEGTYYWAFYINGEAAMVGADGYKLNAGDAIAFKYESWETPPKEAPVTEEPGEDTNPPVEPISLDVLQNSVDNAAKYVLSKQAGEWEVIALKGAGKPIPETYLQSVTKAIQDKEGKFRSITDYEKYTMGILAAGGDPTNVAGYNLVEAIYNGNVTKQGLNGVAFGLIALNSASLQIPESAVWTREKLLTELLKKQNTDGGWAWDGSATSDIDSTAMVLTALAPYQNQVDVKSNVEKAVQFLSAKYKAEKIDNSSTAAQAVIALSALGIDANGEAFTKNNGESLIEFLFTFQNSDGGFDWMGGDESDSFSTAQAFQGIVAYQLYATAKGTLYSFSIGKSIEQPISTPVQEEDGLPLPNTAVNSYNLILFGMLLLLMGAMFYISEKRRKA